jgi:hypothetical protein
LSPAASYHRNAHKTFPLSLLLTPHAKDDNLAIRTKQERLSISINSNKTRTLKPEISHSQEVSNRDENR